MEPTQLFELVIVMFLAIIALHYAARKLGLPPSVALLAGGALLAFMPGLPAITIDPGLVLVIFLPPLLLDGAWTIAVARLRYHIFGISSLAVGAVLFTCVVVAVVMRLLFPSLPWAVCAALGAIVAPPDAVGARAVLQRVTLPRRLQILLEGESLLNDASGLVLFRFAVAAVVTGAFSPIEAAGNFLLLACGGALIGIAVGVIWVKFVRRLGDEYLIIATTTLLAWISYLLGEMLHVSSVIATVTTGLIMTWYQHSVLSAAMRMRGGSFWTVVIFLMEATVFILIGLSLRDVIDRSGGFWTVATTMGLPALAVLAALIAARFIWIFASDLIIKLCNLAGLAQSRPLGIGGTTVLSWAGVRGVVTLALALSLPESFPARDFILVTSFVVIVGTVLVQGTTLGRVITWARLVESEPSRPLLTMSQAESAMAQVQLSTVQSLAHDADGNLIHPQLLDRYQRRSTIVVDYAARTEHYIPILNAHFDVILEAVAAGRRELIRLYRTGQIDDETLRELEHDLDLEELGAVAAKT